MCNSEYIFLTSDVNFLHEYILYKKEKNKSNDTGNNRCHNPAAADFPQDTEIYISAGFSNPYTENRSHHCMGTGYWHQRQGR